MPKMRGAAATCTGRALARTKKRLRKGNKYMYGIVIPHMYSTRDGDGGAPIWWLALSCSPALKAGVASHTRLVWVVLPGPLSFIIIVSPREYHSTK